MNGLPGTTGLPLKTGMSGTAGLSVTWVYNWYDLSGTTLSISAMTSVYDE